MTYYTCHGHAASIDTTQDIDIFKTKDLSLKDTVTVIQDFIEKPEIYGNKNIHINITNTHTKIVVDLYTECEDTYCLSVKNINGLFLVVHHRLKKEELFDSLSLYLKKGFG